MPNTPITELDFFGVKEQLKTFLKSQDRFRDYDFDGSNMSVLLDVLAYNAYQTNFYTNMALAESFLDSAVLQQSVMSHAKSLNYLPRSARCSVAVVDVTVVSSNNEASFIIPNGSKFTSRSSDGTSYTFYTNTGHIALREAGTNRYVASCVEILEGVSVTERFSVTADFDGFYIQNPSVDVSTIKLTDSTTGDEYFFRNDIFGVSADDTVFYLEPDKESYRIVFGNGVFGAQPDVGDLMVLTYLTSNGDSPNGINKFSSSQFSNATVTVRTPARGGAMKESVDSIKFYAPRSIQVQERAVTRRDYELLLKQRFPQILDVSAHDGADLIPPQHGRVAVSVNVTGGLSSADKSAFLSYLEDKTPVAIRPVFIDAGFMYISLNVTVRVSDALRTKSDGELMQIVRDAISSYDTVNLEKFGSVYRDSRLSAAIDSSDRSILSSAVYSSPYIEYSPDLGIKSSPTFKFGAKLVKPYPFSVSSGFTSYTPAIKGETFVYSGTRAFFQDDGVGSIQIVSSDSSAVRVIDPAVGTVDYDTGEVRLVNFSVDSFEGSAIKIRANVLDEDITAPKNLVLTIRDEDVSVTVVSS